MASTTPNLKLKFIIGIVGMLAITSGMFIAVQNLSHGKWFAAYFIEKTLKQGVAEANNNCPKMLDEQTRFDQVTYHEGRIFEYRYTMVNILADEFDVESVREKLEETILENTKTNVDLAYLRTNNVTFRHLFYDKKGKELLTVLITPEQYQTE